MEYKKELKEEIWKIPPTAWLLLVVIFMLLGLSAMDGLKEMLRFWETREEYSHGYIIPFITLFFIWQKKDLLQRISFQGSWAGLFPVLLGIVLIFLGNLSTIAVITQYGFLAVILGLVLSYTGWQGIRPILIPLLFLAFMIPLPGFFLNNLSAELQLLSSKLGVAVIRMFDISVYLEGNVIDLGTFKLQVVDACSGLRYLFPLMSLAFIAAYFYSAPFWKRAVIFFSSIPVTIFMNSFRIGVIGVLVEYWGQSLAEGFLHDFEGWIIFMACTAILVLEMWVLAKIGRDKKPLREVFGIDYPLPTPKHAKVNIRPTSMPFIASGLVILVASVGILIVDDRQEILPERMQFSEFPMKIEGWNGKFDRMEQIYLDALKLDDYIVADFYEADKNSVTGDGINFYVAYYASQKTGESAHSPRSCLPGGGWVIKEHSQRRIGGITIKDSPLNVNRVLIQKGDYAQVVYYWFQQRGRIITNEYLVKWYIFIDSLLKNRSDGALVRLVARVRPGEELASVDARLLGFSKQVVPILEGYVPN